MKHTASMIYKPTQESRELFLYATNNGDLYRQQITSIINSLRRRAKKGTYNSELAVDAYYYAACTASDLYNKDFGYRFTVQDRYTAAVDMEKYYREDQVFYGLEG